ncbi:uncharacterized protein TRAVEDRAFT_137504 [Trametes versicolor FP-101664 SS1]|uniref:DDE Tnp4 domain-containing protein n=1 Tax=Trametes versicolor (strain FP-101664) TaxID=717944 RepID=R7S718_TRAVS|nr:uncharacterized protein TRAVEDRAFT_125927 [Trametes versicolor FP-101664 SS1]XP_008045739.1 uncharacterized protein TRAVEDRAFT_137504 [Trametes versicolor FP-101664 SS1]EIW51377.1 hypothetical protein TRAVEDRAFT_137504 [Trametes versicolor FP-101664 SS1]EIW57829.1 hypothetical protein TRAVEDRAFT_125927 [Trametes versicolor FP-101664 SS1]
MQSAQSSSGESSGEEELDDVAILAAAVSALGSEEARLERAEKRQPSRRYLRRPQLLPNPRCDTPWQVLYDSQDDRAFITTMGIDCGTFEYILESGFRAQWESEAIPRPDADPTGAPRLGRRSLTAEGALGLIYHYLTSAMPDTALQQIFALVPSTVSRYRAFAMTILCNTLRKIPEAAIEWWATEEECRQDSDLICARHPLLQDAIGSIDGLNLLTASSDDTDIENATYNGWLHGHFTSCVFTFSPQGLIKAAVLNAPGSWHDAKIARPIYDKLRDRTPPGYYLVADTAFPRGTNSIAGRIQAPLKAGQTVPANLQEQEAVLARNRQLLSFRQTAEWGMRQLRAGFGRLRLPLDINDPEGRLELLEVCARSCNVRAVRVGINEIRTVYMRYWQEAEDNDIWTDFDNVIFGELQRRDRVARFHLVVVDA